MEASRDERRWYQLALNIAVTRTDGVKEVFQCKETSFVEVIKTGLNASRDK